MSWSISSLILHLLYDTLSLSLCASNLRSLRDLHLSFQFLTDLIQTNLLNMLSKHDINFYFSCFLYGSLINLILFGRVTAPCLSNPVQRSLYLSMSVFFPTVPLKLSWFYGNETVKAAVLMITAFLNYKCINRFHQNRVIINTVLLKLSCGNYPMSKCGRTNRCPQYHIPPVKCLTGILKTPLYMVGNCLVTELVNWNECLIYKQNKCDIESNNQELHYISSNKTTPGNN